MQSIVGGRYDARHTYEFQQGLIASFFVEKTDRSVHTSVCQVRSPFICLCLSFLHGLSVSSVLLSRVCARDGRLATCGVNLGICESFVDHVSEPRASVAGCY